MINPVREATVEDADAIGALHVASWQTAYRGLLPDELLDGLVVAEWQDRRRRHLGAPMKGSLNWVVEERGKVVGWAAAGPTREKDLADDVMELYAMYLDPAAVGRGFGRALMERVLAWTGEAEVVLWVLGDNDRARGFYEKAGFLLDERVEEEPFHGARSIRMRRVGS